MAKRRKRRFVKEIEFKVRKNRSLIISLGMPSVGLDRIIIENKNGTVEVRAEGHSRFEFSDEKIDPGFCDFWLSNPSTKILLEDYLLGCFWGQFNWGELFKYQNNKALKRRLAEEVKKLTHEFEANAAEKLNRLVRRAR